MLKLEEGILNKYFSETSLTEREQENLKEHFQELLYKTSMNLEVKLLYMIQEVENLQNEFEF